MPLERLPGSHQEIDRGRDSTSSSRSALSQVKDIVFRFPQPDQSPRAGGQPGPADFLEVSTRWSTYGTHRSSS